MNGNQVDQQTLFVRLSQVLIVAKVSSEFAIFSGQGVSWPCSYLVAIVE